MAVVKEALQMILYHHFEVYLMYTSAKAYLMFMAFVWTVVGHSYIGTIMCLAKLTIEPHKIILKKKKKVLKLKLIS